MNYIRQFQPMRKSLLFINSIIFIVKSRHFAISHQNLIQQSINIKYGTRIEASLKWNSNSNVRSVASSEGWKSKSLFVMASPPSTTHTHTHTLSLHGFPGLWWLGKYIWGLALCSLTSQSPHHQILTCPTRVRPARTSVPPPPLRSIVWSNQIQLNESPS